MSLRMIHRLALSSCKNKINIDAYWGIVPSLRTLQKGSTLVQTQFLTHDVCIIHKRLFHNSTILQLQKNKLKENETGGVENISTFQIKKRPTRRNNAIISDDKTPKPDTWNVKALATAEEYNLEALAYGLLDQQLYIPSKISTSTNCKVNYISQRVKYYNTSDNQIQ
ncbi:uncharacterized protein LOC115236244 [Formica exsecta]|uniref:uncharacterized protein LOC115236244 n=1 Tax=Formica exsecta TaxID=72781 RepID=UPI001141E4AD|nr:uncharacterized protein LOC115236244 [Formica exsecta]